jgi:hypothetical protein
MQRKSNRPRSFCIFQEGAEPEDKARADDRTEASTDTGKAASAASTEVSQKDGHSVVSQARTGGSEEDQ